MTLESKLSTSDPPNNGQVIDSGDKTETTEKILVDYCKAKIDHNHPNFHMIWKTIEKKLRDLRASIDLLNKSQIPY